MGLPTALGGAARSAGLTAIIASLLFIFPILTWYRYSERIASSGGLYTFVDAATNRGVARVQAVFWIASYFLYLVYTVPFIAYDLLPVVFPGIDRYSLLIDGLIAGLITVIMLTPVLFALSLMAGVAGLQIIVAVALAAVTIGHLGVPPSSFVGHGNLRAILPAAGNTSLLYVCASLPLFLGGEVRGGARSVQRALAWAFPAVAALVIIAAIPLAKASGTVLNATIPGMSLAQEWSGSTFAVIVGLGVAASVGGLIIAEFLALTRLLAAILNKPIRRIVRSIAALFLIASLISLINPRAAYSMLLKPSLIALWISQFLVVAVYPWFVTRHRKLAAGDIALAGVASLLMVFGAYSAATSATT
jgi:amino acid transporter